MRAGEVFTSGDLMNLLAAIARAAGAASSGDGSPHRAAYRKGFADAIAAVALAVGVPATALGERLQPFDVGRLSEAVRR